MSDKERQKRIARATELRTEYPSSAEVLDFLVELLQFGQELQVALEGLLGDGLQSFTHPLHLKIAGQFPRFLKMIETKAPEPIANEAQRTADFSDREHLELLNTFWTRPEATTPLMGQQVFLVRAFLQPYAEFVRARSGKQKREWTPSVCPFCSRKPGVGVLRPLGDGGQRFLVCSFCLGEWEFRRIVCAGCGEENELKLPVYAADKFNHVRVECCDSCRCYIKTVDLTRNGLADPMVDEIASIPLDLWARGQGYSKLQSNLLML